MFITRSVSFLAALLLVSSSSSLCAQSGPTITTTSPAMVRLGWKPSPSANVSGYFLCWGFVSGQCTNRLDAGSVTNVSLTGLISGPTYYFTVVAYSSFGDEAPPSNEVSYALPTTTPNQAPTMDAIGDLTIPQGSSPQTILITGIGPGSSSEYQLVTLSATSSKPSLVNPVAHLAAPYASTATLTLAIAADVVGTATITVVADDGQLTNNLTTRTFNVTVLGDIVAQTPLANVTIAPYSNFRYLLPSPFPSANNVVYALEPGSPDSARIDEHEGIAALTWIPTSAYASTTNLLSVRAADSTDPTLTTNFLLVVNVLDYLSVSPGAIAAEAGSKAGLPLYIVCSEPLSKLTFALSWPAENLGIPSLELADGSFFTSGMEVQETNLLINLTVNSGSSSVGSNLLGTLRFTASSNQISGFLPVRATILTGTKPNNEPFIDLFPGLGEVAVVAGHPLLKAMVSPDASRMLNLYGRVGTAYRVLYTTNLVADPLWQPLTTYAQTNVVQQMSIENTAPTIFYRLEQQ